MKISLNLKPKYKMALTLLIMVSLILGGILIERQCIKDINYSTSSIYKDRLLPATAIFHLSDHLTQRRFILEDYVEDEKKTPGVYAELTAHSTSMDSIITAFEMTYLVHLENESLNALKENLSKYDLAEARVLLQYSANKSNRDFEQLLSNFSSIRSELIELSAIQTSVGKELMSSNAQSISQAQLVSNFQVAILLILCLIAQIFIIASKAIVSPIKQKHNLN